MQCPVIVYWTIAEAKLSLRRKINLQMCEHLIKSGKNSEETSEIDKLMLVVKAEPRCDHYT